MKAIAALTLALAGAVVAQDGLGLPECAQSCASSFLAGGIGNCGRDVKCICQEKSFLSDIACCLAGDCSAQDQAQAVSVAANLCRGVGVTDLPSSVSCATASTSATGSAASAPTTGSASTTASGSGTTFGPTNTATAAATETSTQSSNLGPRPTAAAGLGAIGGIIAAVALL
ncbi:hypothetical protein MYCTH_2299445 [Thermothelomyces thermophilus ATCC 42464]|uniref:CFEM domain-containing protein n=1 Tax=Thermothelomyces thermophilus (strain ATCC 42464 / BCRC 31852 / DSM 1799) TaxID=573729 RepID=G2Q638_THET4|nr:uncharacterized protein MYCTH_2299445 [Thermothelomyces thermophilus ATCC 42464]AEO55517.1 hypothetical protein MYCTH_2299445 [Thermothelomyces thermophilus ATCC 42464]